MHFADRIRDRRRSDGPSHAPSGDTVGFRKAIDGDRAIGHAVEARDRDVLGVVVDDVLVNFVGDGDDIELDAEIANQFEFRQGEHFAGGIVRRVQNDRLGVVVKGGTQFAFIEGPLAIRRAVADAASRIAAWLRRARSRARNSHRTAQRSPPHRPRCTWRAGWRSWPPSIRNTR